MTRQEGLQTSMINNNETAASAPAAMSADDEAAEFAELLEDIAELCDDDTEVEHMDLETYRKGKRS